MSSDSPSATPTDPLDLEGLLHPEEQESFRRLCLPTSSSELAELAGVVRMHLVHVRDQATARTDLEMAEKVGAAFEAVLTSTDGFAADERALMRGAVEYFLMAEDASGDLDDVMGFDDDARILNSVLERVGRKDLEVPFG